jgi:hypothetical protein
METLKSAQENRQKTTYLKCAMTKLPTECTLSFISLFYANSIPHVSAHLGHPQGDSQVAHYIKATDGCPTVAGFFVVHTASNMET